MKKITETCLYISLALFAISCRSVKESTDTFTQTKDSVYVIEKPVIVNVPGSTVTTQSINIDSLYQLLKSGISPQVISKTLIKEDPQTGLKIGILIDQLGNLSAVCEQQDRMIQMMQLEINRLREINNTTVTTITEVPSFWKKIGQAAIWFLIGAAVVFVISFLRQLTI